MYPYHFWSIEQAIAQRQKKSFRQAEYEYQVQQALKSQRNPRSVARLLKWMEDFLKSFKVIARKQAAPLQQCCCEG
jgi:hypothetical protein